MTRKVILKQEEVMHVAELANLILTQKEVQKFLPQLVAILDFVSKLQKLNTRKIGTTSQVTGLVNVFREDAIDDSRTLSQKEALKNAHRTHNGFFVVPAIFES